VHKQHSYSAREKRAAKAAQALLHAGCLWGGGSRPYGWSLIVIPSEGVSAAFSGAARRGIPMGISLPVGLMEGQSAQEFLVALVASGNTARSE